MSTPTEPVGASPSRHPLCIDCVHYVGDAGAYGDEQVCCYFDGIGYDLVTGRAARPPFGANPRSLRYGGECGIEGRFFSPKTGDARS